MPHPAAASARHRSHSRTLAERAQAETRSRRFERSHDIYRQPDTLLEALIQFGRQDLFADEDAVLSLLAASIARDDFSRFKELAGEAADKMAAAEVHELSEDDVQSQDDADNAERRRDEAE